jgi:predicted transcriptional regulator
MKAAHRLWIVVAGSVLALNLLGLAPRLAAQDEKPQGESAEREPVNPKILEFMKPVEVSDDDDELARKLKERHNVAVKLFEARVEDYRRSFGTLALALDAGRQVVDAKLDLATSRDEQLAVYEGALEVARAIEKHFQELSEAGVGSTTDLQRAKLARVTVEVQILKLKRQP